MAGPMLTEAPFEPILPPAGRGGGSTKPGARRDAGGVLESEASGRGRGGGPCLGDGAAVDSYNAIKFSSSSSYRALYPSE